MNEKIGRYIEAKKQARRESSSHAIRAMQADEDAKRYRQGRVLMTPELLAHHRTFGIELPRPWEIVSGPMSEAPE